MQKRKKRVKKITKKIKEECYSEEFMEKNRVSINDFTRKRKLPFLKLIIFMLSIVKKTLQKELSDFFNLISPKQKITKSAFSQSRLKLKHTAFIRLNDVFLKEFYKEKSLKLWNRFRLLAVDGSTLKLPSSKDIVTFFGTNKNSTMPIARISSCFDVLNEIIIDAQISPKNVGEFSLAQKHFNAIKKKDLLIYDRGYGAIWFMYLHIIKSLNFVIRLQEKSFKEANDFRKSKEISKVLNVTRLPWTSRDKFDELKINFKPFKIRLVKVRLDNGEIEILATTLLNEKKYLTSIFKNLYFKRWGIETNYGHLKNNLLLEDFTGLTTLSIKQDFFANIFISNYQTLIISEAYEENRDKFSNREHEYKINKNLSLGYLKDKITMLFIKKNPDEIIEELKKLFLIELNPIRDGRKFSREKSPIQRKFSINHKRAI